MALNTSEVRRIKYELGYGGLSVSAEPYISYVSLFDQVVQPYLTAGASTTSSTAVVAATTPTPTTLTLASVTGFSAGDTVIVDVDARQESATVQNVDGSTITALLSGVHTGSYPVTVEGGESIVRGILQKLQSIAGIGMAAGGLMGSSTASVGIKKVDEVEFFGGGEGSFSRIAESQRLREYWRDELAAALGVVRLNAKNGATMSIY